MSTLLDRVLGRLGYERASSSQPAPRLSRQQLARLQHERAFTAAMGGRLLGSWNSAAANLNDDLRTQLPTIRGRSRDICMNNPYGIQFLRKVKQNVVGPQGVKYQARARRPDRTLDRIDNDRLETGYKLSGRRGNYEVTGTMGRAEAQRQMVSTVARDGEGLVRFLRGYPNEVGFAVEHMNVDRLDWSYNVDRLQNGNRVIMGKELDGFNRCVAYHILTDPRANLPFSAGVSGTRERVPAQDILHIYLPFREEAVRGIPWMHAGLAELKHLGEYKASAVVAARVGADKVGWIRGGDGAPTGEEEEDSDGNIIMPSEAGEFGQLPDDAELVGWEPEYPHQQFEMFNKVMTQGISSAFGVSYPTFANDLTGVNFSSMRGGVMDERDCWMMLQDWFIESYCIPVFEAWLSYVLLARTIPAMEALPLNRMEKFREAEFQGRRWQWVDPLKDTQSNIARVGKRMASRSYFMRQEGIDPDEMFEEIAAEEQRMRELGIEDLEATDIAPTLEGAEEDA